MSMYRKEWGCCGSITETEAWEPEDCPFCKPLAQQTEPVEPGAWVASKDGRVIYDDASTDDGLLRVSGDFEDDEQRSRYAQRIVDKLNAALAQQAEPVQEPVATLIAQRDALLEALKTYGWHTKDCPQHPTYARPKNWPDCNCGFDAAIRARGNT